jgi:hypothetical protein
LGWGRDTVEGLEGKRIRGEKDKRFCQFETIEFGCTLGQVRSGDSVFAGVIKD